MYGTEEKMSKSLGNFWTIRDALKETNGKYGDGNGNETLRFFLLRSHYRSPISFNPGLIEDAHKGLTRLYSALNATAPQGNAPIDWTNPFAARFKAAMDDDFNTPQAVGVLFDLAAEINRTKDGKLAAVLVALGKIFNILTRDPAVFIKGATAGLDEAAIEGKIAERTQAKAQKDWAKADAIRKELTEAGIVLEDRAGVTTWRRA